jgi:hypothetical protein
MKRLLMSVAAIGALATGSSAFSADFLLRAYAAHRSAHGPGGTPRPPSAIRDLSGRHSNVAMSALNARDSHVLEFLHWKEQLRSGTSGSR